MIERFLNSDLFAFLVFAAMIYITVRLIRHYRYHGSDGNENRTTGSTLRNIAGARRI